MYTAFFDDRELTRELFNMCISSY